MLANNSKKLNSLLKIFCVFAVLTLATTAEFLIFPVKPAQADYCGQTKETPGWSCVDTASRKEGSSGCQTNLCEGSANRLCCPPGEGIRGGLGAAAGQAGIQTFPITSKIGDIISYILGFVGIIFLILTIAGGLMWMTAGGSEERVAKAKKLIVNATIGIILVFSAYAITYFVTETLLK